MTMTSPFAKIVLRKISAKRDPNRVDVVVERQLEFWMVLHIELFI